MAYDVKLPHKSILVGFVLLALGTARASTITFNLTPPALRTSPGGTVEFTGTLTNTGSSDVFLNGDSALLLYPLLTLDDSPFFANAPLSLAASGGSYSGPFFDVIFNPATLPSIYAGSFTIQGGADSNAFDNLATQNFQVAVSSVPEPETLILVAIGVVCVILASSVVGNGRSASEREIKPIKRDLRNLVRRRAPMTEDPSTSLELF